MWSLRRACICEGLHTGQSQWRRRTPFGRSVFSSVDLIASESLFHLSEFPFEVGQLANLSTRAKGNKNPLGVRGIGGGAIMWTR